jgi:hypothetical protein
LGIHLETTKGRRQRIAEVGVSAVNVIDDRKLEVDSAFRLLSQGRSNRLDPADLEGAHQVVPLASGLRDIQNGRPVDGKLCGHERAIGSLPFATLSPDGIP